MFTCKNKVTSEKEGKFLTVDDLWIHILTESYLNETEYKNEPSDNSIETELNSSIKEEQQTNCCLWSERSLCAVAATRLGPHERLQQGPPGQHHLDMSALITDVCI